MLCAAFGRIRCKESPLLPQTNHLIHLQIPDNFEFKCPPGGIKLKKKKKTPTHPHPPQQQAQHTTPQQQTPHHIYEYNKVSLIRARKRYINIYTLRVLFFTRINIIILSRCSDSDRYNFYTSCHGGFISSCCSWAIYNFFLFYYILWILRPSHIYQC